MIVYVVVSDEGLNGLTVEGVFVDEGAAVRCRDRAQKQSRGTGYSNTWVEEHGLADVPPVLLPEVVAPEPHPLVTVHIDLAEVLERCGTRTEAVDVIAKVLAVATRDNNVKEDQS